MSSLFLGAMIVIIVIVVVLPFFGLTRSAERRFFWCLVATAGLAAALSTYPTWHDALKLALIPLGAMTIGAWAYTPYLKIGGRIYALNVKDRRPDPGDEPALDAAGPASDDQSDIEYDDDAADFGDKSSRHHASDSAPAAESYSGMLTPATMWWVMVGLSVIAAGNIYAYFFSEGKAPVALMMAVFVSLLALATGYGDASWGYRIARGSYIPFSIASLITAGGFAAIYLAAYYTAGRWPLRRAQSMEQRAHPRHQRRGR